ncbi:MAG: biotin/lipoyl-binding protein, partial [bacterium]|nr:biotin/lipoyl-binding protein [bacterium]
MSTRSHMTDQTQEDSDQQPLYRQQAYQQRGRVAPIDGILRVSAPREWLMLIILAAVVAAVIAWSVLGRLESGISAACALRAAGERHVVAAPASGVVTEVLVEPGRQVSAGDPLVRVAAPEISLAAEVAEARAAAVVAQHPGSPEAAGAAAEAEVLRAAEAAGTLVLSPASGVLAPLVVSAGTAVDPGSAVAEVLRFGAGPPTVVLAVDSSAAAR